MKTSTHAVEWFTMDPSIKQWMRCTCGLEFASAVEFLSHKQSEED